jgi:hypothetical protein
MLDFTNDQFANHLLAVVPEPEMALMAPHLKLQRLRAGELLSDSGETVKHVYFHCVDGLSDGGWRNGGGGGCR